MPIPLALVGPTIRVAASAAAAYQAYETIVDLQASAERYLDANKPSELAGTHGHNDAQDAFRHSFASAKMALQLGEGVANFAGTVYEYKGEARGQPKSEQGMDLWNNRAGRELARDLPGNATDKQIGDAVLAAIRDERLIVRTSDPRTEEGLRSVLTLDEMGQKMQGVLNNAKAMFADMAPQDVAAARAAAKDMPPELLAALAKGAERADGFSNTALESRFSKLMEAHVGGHSPVTQPRAEALAMASASDGLAGVRIPGVDFGMPQQDRRELER